MDDQRLENQASMLCEGNYIRSRHGWVINSLTFYVVVVYSGNSCVRWVVWDTTILNMNVLSRAHRHDNKRFDVSWASARCQHGHVYVKNPAYCSENKIDSRWMFLF